MKFNIFNIGKENNLENIANNLVNVSNNVVYGYGSIELIKYMDSIDFSNTTQALTSVGLGLGLYKLNKKGLMKKFSKKINSKVNDIKFKGSNIVKNLALVSYLAFSTFLVSNVVKDVYKDVSDKIKNEKFIEEIKEDVKETVLTILNDRRSIEGRFQRTVRWDSIFQKYETKYRIEEGILAGLAMRESYGNPLQLNNTRDGGAGLFQFQPGTARHYGLNVYGNSFRTSRDTIHGQELLDLLRTLNYSYEDAIKHDGRFSVEKSTEAAAKFLNDLYQNYNNWDKAISAYNIGQRRNVPVNTRHVRSVRRYQEYYLENKNQ